MTNILTVWADALEIIRPEMAKVSFDTWIMPITPYLFENDTFVLCTNTQFMQAQLNSKYLILISNALSQVVGRDIKAKIILDNQKDEFEFFEVKSEDEKKQLRNTNITNINSKYTFENFVVGEGNRLAHAASLAVAENPAAAYNPLFLYGCSGLGKTHLMHAIGNFISENNPRLKIMYVTSEFFTNELINAIKDNKNEAFRNKYREIDVLLIDDIQFIGGKKQTEEEFFHTFNHLHQAEKQIIISSDRHPREMNTLEERLRTRFEWGLTCDIQSPDYETRFAILQKKLQTLDTKVPDEVIDFIAKNVNSNIRELEGALTRITAYAKLAGTEINLTVAKSNLKEYCDSGTRIYTLNDINKCVADYYDVTTDDIMSKKKPKNIATARQMAMYICRNLLDYSFNRIGTEFKRDHTTVMHAVNLIESEIKKGSVLKNDYTNIITAIKQN